MLIIEEKGSENIKDFGSFDKKEAGMDETAEIVILLTNGTVIVLDEYGAQISALQGNLIDVFYSILRHSDETTKFFFGSFDPPELWPSSKAAFRRMTKEE